MDPDRRCSRLGKPARNPLHALGAIVLSPPRYRSRQCFFLTEEDFKTSPTYTRSAEWHSHQPLSPASLLRDLPGRPSALFPLVHRGNCHRRQCSVCRPGCGQLRSLCPLIYGCPCLCKRVKTLFLSSGILSTATAIRGTLFAWEEGYDTGTKAND